MESGAGCCSTDVAAASSGPPSTHCASAVDRRSGGAAAATTTAAAAGALAGGIVGVDALARSTVGPPVGVRRAGGEVAGGTNARWPWVFAGQRKPPRSTLYVAAASGDVDVRAAAERGRASEWREHHLALLLCRDARPTPKRARSDAVIISANV